MAIAGASRFINAATLANQQGIAAQQSNIISNLGTVSLLDVGRSVGADNGIGLSSRARALNSQFIEANNSTFNQIFSLGVAATSSVEALQTQIAALRSSLPDSSLARELRGNFVDGDVDGTAASDTGSVVDEEA